MKNIIKVTVLIVALSAVTSVHTSTLDEFIVSDKTNEMAYVEGVFDCWQFTETFINHARFYGFEAYPVYAILEKNGKFYSHAFVEVVDNGIVYWIEPQNDMSYVVTERKTPLCFTDGRCVADQFIFHVDYEYLQNQ